MLVLLRVNKQTKIFKRRNEKESFKLFSSHTFIITEKKLIPKMRKILDLISAAILIELILYEQGV